MNALPSFVTILFDSGFFGRGVGLSATEKLQTLLYGYGIEADVSQCARMLRHLELLVERNATTNLTRVTTLEEAMVVHVLDSLLPLPYLSGLMGYEKVSFVDIGTGGGFPGIPLACMTDWEGTLIDSVGKKTAAVQGFIDELDLGPRVQAVRVRAEDLAREQPGAFDFVVTRAVAQANVLLEYASPLLRADGHLVLYKARPSYEELSAAKRAAKLCGMSLVSRETFELPEDAGHRALLYYRKAGKSKIKLPRRTGLATKEPLGL